MSQIVYPSPEFIARLHTRKIPLRMQYMTSGMRNADLPPSSRLEIALVGRSNVGKSSLLNFMAGQRQLARVSSSPGRTQTINVFGVEDESFHLVDLPGFGFALSPRETQIHWEKAMSEFFEEREALVAALFLVDVRRDIEEADRLLCQWLVARGLTVLAVQTKCDKIHKSQWPFVRLQQSRTLGLAPGMMVTTSADKKLGLTELCVGIAGMLEAHTPTPLPSAPQPNRVP